MNVGSAKDVYLSLPRGEINQVKAKYVIDKKELDAPLAADEQVGEIQVMDKDKQIASYPLVALQEVKQGGIITRITDYVKKKL